MFSRYPQVRYQPHPVRNFTLKPCQEGVYTYSSPVRISCEGFRIHGQAAEAGPADELRILAIGDSFTFGLGVGEQESWPAQLESQLAAQLPNSVRVLNAGTVSYGVFQELDLLKEILPKLKPNWVVHGLFWNDYQSAHAPREGAPKLLTDDGHFAWSRQPRVGVRRAWEWLTSHSSLLTLVHRTISRLQSEGGTQSGYGEAYRRMLAGELTSAELEPISDFYRELQALQQVYGFELITLVMPISGLADQETSKHPYPEWVRTMLKKYGIRYVDAFEYFGKKGYTKDLFLNESADPHLAAAGYRELAGELSLVIIDESTTARHPE